MRIFTDKSEQYIQTLAHSIGKDPASLESWRCIHIHPAAEMKTPWENLQEPLLTTLESNYRDLACDVVQCTDHDILLIGQSPDINYLYQVQDDIIHSFPEGSRIESHVYDLLYHWREIRKLLLSKVEEDKAPALSDDSANFGEVDSLDGIFSAAKTLRKARNPLHILLVEDDEMTRRLVSNLFKEQYAMFTAKDAQEAVENYLLHAPDIVFLDINLPDQNGFQVLRQILASDPDAYVVMFSGNSYLDNVTHALNAGASGFVAKPFSREKMRHYIEDCAMSSGKIS